MVVMVISGRASLKQDLLRGLMTAIGRETAVPSGDLKRDHGAEIMVHACRHREREISLCTQRIQIT